MTFENIDELKEEIRKDIQEGMKKFKIPGTTIAIVDKDDILWSEGFGFTDNTKSKKVNADTLFMIGSLSKAYTVTAFLRAMQKGKIDLDDPLKKHYPEFTMNMRYGDEELDKITFRHLLTHRAGFQHFTFTKDPNEDKIYPFEKYVQEISNGWQNYHVGTRNSYSNASFDLVAYVLQKISGMSFADYMMKEVYQPLGMDNSRVNPVDALSTDNVAIGYRGEAETPYEELLQPFLGAGAQFSSVNDMAKYLMMHFNEGKINGEKFLEKQLLEEMYKIPFAEEDQLLTIGMGFGVGKYKYGGQLTLRFFGDGPGYCNLHILYPKLGIGMLMQTNQVNGTIQFIFNILKKIDPFLVKLKLGKIPEDIDIRENIKLPVKTQINDLKLKRLAGLYISRMLDISIEHSDDKLKMNLRGKEITLQPHTETIFSTDEYAKIEFKLDDTGRPITIKLHDNVGNITYLDYDSGPEDRNGMNKKEWQNFSDIYRSYYSNFCLYSTTEVRNGHLFLITSLGNKIRHLEEFKPNIFFTADGQNVIFKGNKLITPMMEWEKDKEISVEKLTKLLKEDPNNKQVNKISMECLLFIYEQTKQEEKAKELKELIAQTYPEKG